MELAGHTRFGGYKHREATYRRGAAKSNVVVMGLSKSSTVGKAVDVKSGNVLVEVRYGKACPRGAAETFPHLPAPQHSQKRSLSASKFTVCKCWAQRRPVSLQRASQSSNIARLTFAELSKSASWRMMFLFLFLLRGSKGSGAVLPHCHHCPILILCRSSESGQVVGANLHATPMPGA